MRVLAVCGSLGARSSNRSLIDLAVSIAPASMEIVVFDGLGELPHFNPDLGEGPPSVGAWRAAIAGCDAMLVACPEYGHSLPGVVKNGIDWLIGSGELERKVVAITAATVAPERGLRGLAALRQTLGAVSAVVVGGAPIARGPDQARELAALLDAILAAGPR